jgi:flavin-dependent dehydrogenase
VLVLERDAEPRERPGETLHPGIEPLLEQLGAAGALHAATLVRHEGHWVTSGGRRRFEPFGQDDRGIWRGFQARRSILDAGLRACAIRAGAELREGIAVSGVSRGRDGRVIGLVSSTGERIHSGVVIDAAGGRHWLARQLGVGVRRLSPRYVASFGYVVAETETGASNGAPEAAEFARDRNGWTWIAPLSGGRWHWTRLSFAGKRMPRRWLPRSLRGLLPVAPSRGADMTWRMARALAGPGWFLCGDAAAVLDPASSHGVQRAVLTGFRAGQMATEGADTASAAYDGWLRAGVERDAVALRASYAGWPDAGRLSAR